MWGSQMSAPFISTQQTADHQQYQERFIMRNQFSAVILFLFLPLACATHSDDAGPAGMHSASSMDSSREALSKAMRDLWADHVVWTRSYIVAATSDHPDAQVAANRLLANQEHIGQAIVPYYGQAAGTQLADLLKDHILIAVDLVAAAKAGDQAELGNADRRWHANAADIATFLSDANPHWPREAVLSMMNEHLALTAQEATARLNENWDEDVRTFDKIFDQAMMMADTFTDGIVKQFPNRFRS